ncbi:hypothetical protein BDB00DRAFT_798069, partial [Zychaea mexicana]|uniref:uncharacterized protein n=1 Tax=Zychaea mexicana TaxID=64656 RepID=UPI0022FEBDD6
MPYFFLFTFFLKKPCARAILSSFRVNPIQKPTHPPSSSFFFFFFRFSCKVSFSSSSFFFIIHTVIYIFIIYIILLFPLHPPPLYFHRYLNFLFSRTYHHLSHLLLSYIYLIYSCFYLFLPLYFFFFSLLKKQTNKQKLSTTVLN